MTDTQPVTVSVTGAGDATQLVPPAEPAPVIPAKEPIAEEDQPTMQDVFLELIELRAEVDKLKRITAHLG